MKSIRKDVVIEHEQLDNLRLEKHILLCVEHPFLVAMEFVFQKESRIYFLMNFVKGGELFKHLTDVRRFDEDRAKFYGAQVALALGYLHSSKILYRDLKPENILMGEDGYIKLADFGLAKLLGDEVANSFCGTPEYLSPEMINGTGHDHTLDWWALGVLIYEMIIGIPPFYNQNKHKMYYLIENGTIRWPDPVKHGINVSEEAKDLISKLLDKNKATRLGQSGGIDEVMAHPWFASIDREALENKSIVPAFKPTIADPTDTKNFDAKFTSMEAEESVIPKEAQKKI